MFGFTVYDSIQHADSGDVAFPTPGERVLGDHAVCVVGYDDEAVITHPTSGQTTTGALAIRNSWGTSWGADGYGRVPYDYVTSGLAEDSWVLVSADFVNLSIFNEQT